MDLSTRGDLETAAQGEKMSEDVDVRIRFDRIVHRETRGQRLAQAGPLSVEDVSVIYEERTTVAFDQSVRGNSPELDVASRHTEVSGEKSSDVIHSYKPSRRRSAG